MKYLSYLIVTATIIFNLYLYYPETQILADPNDNNFQFSLVNRTDWVWKNYGCPLSLWCLPNLIDHNVPNWAEGYPLPFYYSHIPQIAIVSSYNLIIKPISSLAIHPALSGVEGFSLYAYLNWTKYLLLCFFPLSVFITLRIVGFSAIFAALGAFFSAHFSTDGLYGIDPPSFLWRGYGLSSQLYAMIFFSLALAFLYRYLVSSSLYLVSNKHDKSKKSSVLYQILNTKYQILFPILFLTLTTAGHLGMGIMAFLSSLAFLFIDLKKRTIIQRGKILALILGTSVFLLSYWIIPVLLNNSYHMVSFWDPIWKFDSYGWYEVVRQFLNGEIFDWGRFPVITFLTIIGFFTLLLHEKLRPFALLFAAWFLLYFGRTTWGGLIDLFPGMKDFHQHRFIVAIQIVSLFLIPAGLQTLFLFIQNTVKKITTYAKSFRTESRSAGRSEKSSVSVPIRSGLDFSPSARNDKFNIENYIGFGIFAIFISVIIYVTVQQTIKYNDLNTKWIYEAAAAFKSGEKDFNNLLFYLSSRPPARIYAGRPGNWGKEQRLGSNQLYMQIGTMGFDISQFLPETWSPLSENEQDFDERVPEDYDLLNIRYIVAPGNLNFPKEAVQTREFGPYKLFEIPTSGWFDLVTSPMGVSSDKTNFLNIVHYWHKSYPRRWKMHPLITVEKNLPTDLQKSIEMTDEVTYINIPYAKYDQLDKSNQLVQFDQSLAKNIFSDFPFIFPEATISARYINIPGVAGIQGLPRGEGTSQALISNEKIYKQTYSATIRVPDPCPYCRIMFKMSYHPDWEVKVDGTKAQKEAVFPFYLATPASPGIHTVEFTYKPNTPKVVLLFSEIFILSVGCIVILLRLPRLLKRPK